MNSISKRLREIDIELSKLYQEKHALELEQQEYWNKLAGYDQLTYNAEDNFETFYGYKNNC